MLELDSLTWVNVDIVGNIQPRASFCLLGGETKDDRVFYIVGGLDSGYNYSNKITELRFDKEAVLKELRSEFHSNGKFSERLST